MDHLHRLRNFRSTSRDVGSGHMAESPSLTPKQQAFVNEYIVDFNATQAAIRAGYSAKTASAAAARMLANVKIQTAVSEAMQKRTERTQVTADLVVHRLALVMMADHRELVELRRHACRYCHGAGHRYHSTPAELERDRAAWEAKQTKASKETFDERGGSGFSAKRDPHPDCPECHGWGVEKLIVHDTRKLSPAAAALYAGVRQTKDGIEVKTANVEATMALLARHVGLGDPDRGEGDPLEHARRVRDAAREMDAADGIAA